LNHGPNVKGHGCYHLRDLIGNNNKYRKSQITKIVHHVMVELFVERLNHHWTGFTALSIKLYDMNKNELKVKCHGTGPSSDAFLVD
jgi:hypothetical protein